VRPGAAGGWTWQQTDNSKRGDRLFANAAKYSTPGATAQQNQKHSKHSSLLKGQSTYARRGVPTHTSHRAEWVALRI